MNLFNVVPSNEETSIDRVRLKNQLVKILQVVIPSIFSPFLLTLPTSTLANFKIQQKSIVHLKINYLSQPPSIVYISHITHYTVTQWGYIPHMSEVSHN